MNKRLVRWIKEYTLSFGPKRKGPNMLINKLNNKEDSFFYRLLAILGKGSFEEISSIVTNAKRLERKQKEEEDYIAKVKIVCENNDISIRDL